MFVFSFAASNFVCKLCGIRFSCRATLLGHQNYYCTKKPQSDQSDGLNGTFRMLIASGLLNNGKPREKRPINGTSKEPNTKRRKLNSRIYFEVAATGIH